MLRFARNDVMMLGFLMELGFLGLAVLGDLRQQLLAFFVIYALQFLLMLWAWSRTEKDVIPAVVGGNPSWWIPRPDSSPEASSTGCPYTRRVSGRQWPRGMTILSFAVLFRLTLLPPLPSVSDDIYRYAWEGRVQRAGFSPYEFPPSAPELAPLRDESWSLINHKNTPTIYPPLTQLVFRVGTYLGGGLRASVLSQKCIFVFFDLLCLTALLALLRQRGLPESRLILYAWNPLVVLEFAGSGHNDSLGIFYMLAGLLAWEKRRFVWATLGLAAAFLSKYVTILLVPFFFWKKKWKEIGLWTVLAAGALVPFCFCWMMVHGASQYAAHWQFNGSLFPVVNAVLGRMDWAKWAVAAAMGLVAFAVGKRENDLARAAFLLIAAALLLAPVVHPWYFIWAIPLLCVFPHPAFLVWNASIVLSYTVWPRYARYQVWDVHPAIQLIEYLPVYSLLCWQLKGSFSRRRREKVEMRARALTLIPSPTFRGRGDS